MKKSYGKRPLRHLLENGIRKVAPTYGKRSYATCSDKAGGLLAPESQAERVVAHLLTVDPSVTGFKTQPFTVDIVSRRILRTREDLAEARIRHRHRHADVFYTPDVEVELSGTTREALEVKLESFEGDGHYQAMLAEARCVLRGFGYQLRRLVLPLNRTHPVYTNAAVLRLARHRPDLEVAPALLAQVEAAHLEGAKSLHDYCAALGLGMAHMPQLLVQGALTADLLSVPISGLMETAPAYGSLDHLRLLGGLEK